jgi:hypothetical protein
VIGFTTGGEEFRLSGRESSLDHTSNSKRAGVSLGIEHGGGFVFHVLIVIASELDKCGGRCLDRGCEQSDLGDIAFLIWGLRKMAEGF